MRRSFYLLVFALGTELFLGLALLLLAGCSPYPAKSYYEMDEAIANAETQEEKDHYEEKMRRIEKEVEKAQLFVEAYHLCLANGNSCQVVCNWHGPYVRDPFNFEKHLTDIEATYVWWMKVRPPTCGFLTSF